MATAIRWTLFAAGILLLMLNVAGRLIPLRNDAVYYQMGRNLPAYISLRPDQVFSAIDRDASGNRKKYLLELTDALNNGVAHYWEDDGIDKYRMRVPVYENYLLHAASYLHPSRFRKYEFMDYRKAVDRGVGFCSQYALIASQILKEKGIPAGIVELDGHVVATAQADPATNEWWILDADYGVVVPHDARTIARDPGLALQSYLAKGYERDKLNIPKYFKNGYRVVDGARGYAPTVYWVEPASYVLIWLIPAVLIMPMLRSWIARARRAGPDTPATGRTGVRLGVGA